MGEPALVIHGVANRDPGAFEVVVSDLSQSLGGGWNLVPTFWGDLGGNPVGVTDTIPDPASSTTRATEPEDRIVAAALLDVETSIRGTAGTEPRMRDSGFQRDQVADAAAEDALIGSAETRQAISAEDVREAVLENWDMLTWLPLIRDDTVLWDIGHIVGSAASRVADGQAAGLGTRGLPDVSGFIRGMLTDIDKAVGAVIGKAAGSFNHYLRKRLVPALVGFAGDVFVYEHQFPRIHARIRSILDEHAPGYGTQDKPIPVIAHSLGGMIAFDAAVAGRPTLWISSLVTFGSQSPFFHVVDPRSEELAAYIPGHPVGLPATIGRWINLWEPLDPLAFVAERVFRLHDGSLPSDRAVHHLASSGLWTHTAYWHHQDLVAAIREAFA